MVKDFFTELWFGLTTYKDAWYFIKKHKMWWYFLIPILLFVGMYYLGYTFQNLQNTSKSTEQDGIFRSAWLFFMRTLYWLLALVIFNFMRYIIIIMISPLLSVVSERVERIITGNVYKFNLVQIIKDVKRTINLAIRNIIWEFGIIALIYAASYLVLYIFQVSFLAKYVATTLSMFVAFYYYGFGFIDYINERRRMNIQQSIDFVKKNRGFSVGLGMVFTVIFHYSNILFKNIGEDVSGFWFFLLVVLIAVITAGIPIFTMVAATLGMHKLIDLKSNPYAIRTEEEVEEEANIAFENTSLDNHSSIEE
jgi:CysZ protein